jgi:hypothetical protein
MMTVNDVVKNIQRQMSGYVGGGYGFKLRIDTKDGFLYDVQSIEINDEDGTVYLNVVPVDQDGQRS